MTEALASPYWRLDDTGMPLSLWQLLGRFPAACRPASNNRSSATRRTPGTTRAVASETPASIAPRAR